MTDKEQILKQVQQILMETFQVSIEEVAPEKNLFTDLDLDSLDAIDMASELSSKAEVKFSNDDLRNIRTVDDVVQAIVAKKSDAS